MDQTKDKTLTDCLFTLVSMLNTVIDRLDMTTDRHAALFELHEDLVNRNKEAFALAREDFLKRLIKAEIEKHRMNRRTMGKHEVNNQPYQGRTNFGSDIVRKAKTS